MACSHARWDEFSIYKKTWNLVVKPKDFKLIVCKWVYKIKEPKYKSSDKRYKANLVAKGFKQREAIDYIEILSLVVKYTSIRILLALVPLFDL